MRTRILRLTAAVSIAALALAGMLSCSASGDNPGDLVGPPGPGGGGPNVIETPDIQGVTPAESCATAGNRISITGFDLVDNDYLASVTIAGISVQVLERIDGGASGLDVLVVSTPALTVPAGGLLVDVRVFTENGADTVTGGLRLFPGCSGPPILVGITPATGARAGFEVIELIGDNLACLTSVQFVSTGTTTVLSAEILSATSDQSLLVRTPPTTDPSAAPYQIVVTSQCGTNASPRPTFTYSGSGVGGGPTLPDATAIFDVVSGLPQGPTTGGNQVRIVGRDLNLATAIRIGDLTLSRATGGFTVTALGDIIIGAMPASPLGASTTLPIAVVVVSADGEDPTAVTYTYIGTGQPNCVGFEAGTPNSGPLEGGTQVTIIGQNLNDVKEVTFGGVGVGDGNLFFPTADGSKIVVITPAFPVAIDVDIALQVGTSPNFTTIDTCAPVRFTYVDINTEPPFSVTAIVPNGGPQTGGTTIVLSGTGLDNVQSLRICGVPATIVSAVSEQVQATTGLFNGTVPATCDVVVTTSTGDAATLVAGFEYRAVVPDAQSFAGDSARTAPRAGGTSFRLQGINLIGVEEIRFGGAQAGALACELNVQSNTEVSGTVPAYITPGAAFPATVSVVAKSAAGVDSTPLAFTYYANPTASNATGPLNDERIQTNERVVLTGNNFRPVNDSFIGEIELSNSGLTGNAGPGEESIILGPGSFTIVNNNRIEFNFPSALRVEDFYDITIRTPRQDAECVVPHESTAARVLFLGARPTTARVLPSSGRWDGGTVVTISGDFSLPVTRVTICGVDQPIVSGSQTATEIQVTTRSTGTEAAAGAPCDVIVFNSAGASDPITGAYTFVRQPDALSVEVVTPNCGLQSSPATIPVTAGQLITIRGTDFGTALAGVTHVFIGGVEAIIASSTRTDTRLDVFVPDAPATGGPRFNVVVEAQFPADTKFTSTLPFAVDYQDTPTITAVTPATAPVGSTITITGTDLRNVSGQLPIVTIGGANATVLSATDTSLSVVVPPGTPTCAATSLQVTTCQGQASSSFTYPAPVPRITSFAPATAAPGTTVLITGTDLMVAGIIPDVLFGTAAAAVNPPPASSPTTLSVTVPAGAAGSRVNLVVTTCGGTATSTAQFEYACAAPAITGVTPGFGVAGTQVTITGTFENAGSAPAVRFGVVPASSIVSFSNAQIVAVAPAGTGTVSVNVTTCGGTALLAAGFTYCSAPVATTVTPATGAAGAVVFIGGNDLQDPNGTPPVVTFTSGTTSQQATVVASSPTVVQVQAPAGLTGVATVTVTTCGGSDPAGTFQYCATPTITNFSPTTGVAGTQVTITGANLIGANGVNAVIRFGGVTVTNVILASATQFIVQAPAGPVGQVAVDATTCGGTGQAATLFSYCPQPVVTALLPTNGAAGDEITIFGTGLVGANGVRGVVTFGTTTATVIDAFADGTEMTVIAPAGFAQGQAVNVRVATCGGTSATGPATVFTYQTSTTCVSPTVTGISPSAAAAGQQITISGTNLIGNDGTVGSVTIGGAPATVDASTPTQLVVTVPAGAGTVSVSVTTCGGTVQSPTLFTYCQVPNFTTLTPNSGAGGSGAILDGIDLIGANGASPQVFFGVAQATIVDQTSTRLTVTVPTGPAPGTTVNVRVVTCGGSSVLRSFQYVSTTQFDVTGVTPSAGPNTGSQVISISGTGLNGLFPADIVDIQICDVSVTSLTPISDTLVQATTAAFLGAVPATCDLEVILNDGRQDTLVGAYTYLPPVPDGVVFDEAGAFTVNAPQVGGTTFRILGTNLIGVTDVNFGGFTGDPKACNVQIASDTELTGIVPAYATPLGTTQSVEVFVESAAGVDPTTVVTQGGVLYRYHPNPSVTGVDQPSMPNGPPVDRLVTVFGTNFIVDGDVFLAPTIRVQNLGLTDPDNFPAGSVFNFDVGIFNITDGTPDSFEFVFPSFTTGDLYSITITTPNQGASCVATFSETTALIFVGAEPNCGDGLDNDGDGLIDCADPDCLADALCP